jgi:hypothetical protein
VCDPPGKLCRSAASIRLRWLRQRIGAQMQEKLLRVWPRRDHIVELRNPPPYSICLEHF